MKLDNVTVRGRILQIDDLQIPIPSGGALELRSEKGSQ